MAHVVHCCGFSRWAGTLCQVWSPRPTLSLECVDGCGEVKVVAREPPAEDPALERSHAPPHFETSQIAGMSMYARCLLEAVICQARCPVEHDRDRHGARSIGRISDQEALAVARRSIVTTHGLILEPGDVSRKQRTR